MSTTRTPTEATPAASTSKKFRVTFQDVTTWEAFIEAPDAETAKELAEECWNEGGTEGFLDSELLNIVSEGCTTDDYQAEEVQS